MITLACSKGSVSESNLTGNTYTIRMTANSAGAGNGIAASIMGLANMEFIFNDNNEGIYRSGAGAMNYDIPIRWSFKNDSITIEQLNQAQPRLDRYAISKIDNDGYLLHNSRSQFALIKK